MYALSAADVRNICGPRRLLQASAQAIAVK